MRFALACSPEMKEQAGTEEDRLLAQTLASSGHQVTLEAWRDEQVQWARLDGTMLRSCWDYHLHLAKFREWLGSLEEACVSLWNPPALVAWNADKRYLFDLENRGLEIVPTELVGSRSETRLEDLFQRFGAEALVIKPVVGASAFGTWRADREKAVALTNRFASEKAAGPLLVQPLLREVLDEGEWSLILIDGILSHTVLKRPGAGDFRVQSELGGTTERREAPEELSTFAQRVLAALDEAPLYARIDIVRRGGRPLLMEVELIEPQLFLADCPPAVDRLVHGFLDRVE